MIPWRKTGKGDAKPVDRVLVIQLGELGEFVRALAAAKAIREHHMGARITLLTHEGMKELAEKCPYFDMVESNGKPKEPQAITQLIARIRAAKYDLIYDLENSPRTANYFHAMKPWPPRWSGSVSGAALAYMANERNQLHPLDRLAQQLKVAGIGDGFLPPPDLRWVRVALRDPPRLRPDYFGIRGRYIVMLPRGADGAPARRWPETKYTEIARLVVGNGVTPVVLGGAEERAVGAAVARDEPAAKNLVTRADLLQCIGLFERAAFVLGDDVDLMHVAAASGAPCLTFLSSSAAPDRAAPRGEGGVVALTAAVIADLPVEQVERQLRNCGVYRQAATA
jgi:ADP-heptose:LPS heptosyltransferase